MHYLMLITCAGFRAHCFTSLQNFAFFIFCVRFSWYLWLRCALLLWGSGRAWLNFTLYILHTLTLTHNERSHHATFLLLRCAFRRVAQYDQAGAGADGISLVIRRAWIQLPPKSAASKPYTLLTSHYLATGSPTAGFHCVSSEWGEWGEWGEEHIETAQSNGRILTYTTNNNSKATTKHDRVV